MKPQLCSPLGRILVLIFGLFASAASPFRADAAPCTSTDLLTSKPTAFIATAPNLLSMLDASATPPSVLCTIAVGTSLTSSPNNLAISPDGLKLYVENDAEASVTIVDLTSAATTTLSLPGVSAPITANIAVSPDNKLVYVVSLPASLGSGAVPSLSILDLTALIPAVGSTPTTHPGIGVSFVYNSVSITVPSAFITIDANTYIWSTTSNTITATVQTGGTTAVTGGTVEVEPLGTFAVVVDGAGNNQVANVPTATPTAATVLSPTPPCGVGSLGGNTVAITPDGSSAYYSCPPNNFVQVIATSSNTVSVTVSMPASSNSHGLAIASDSSLAFVANGDGSVSTIAIPTTNSTTPATTSLGSASLGGLRLMPVTQSVTPATASVPTGTQLPFASTLRFPFSSKTVSWSVSCTAGGAACGTIDSAGNYTAPNVIPNSTVTVTATYPDIPASTQKFFPATAAVTVTPSQLAFTVQPTDVVSAAAITPAVQVSIEDANGTVVTTATNAVTIAIGTNAGGGTLSGTLTTNAVNGVATFSNLNIDKTGTGYTLAASAATLTGATSTPFNVTAGPPAKLAFTVQPTNVVSAVAITPAVQVSIQDAQGNLVPTATNAVTIAIGTNPGTGTLSGTATVTASGGVATFSNLSIDKTGTGYTLAASSGVLTGATSNTFNVAPGPPAKLAFTPQPPASSPLGGNVTPFATVTVSVEDLQGNLVPTATNSVTITSTPANVGGTTTVPAVNGVATFSNLLFTIAGNNYTLTSASAPLTSANSNPFALTTAIAVADNTTFSNVLIEDIPAPAGNGIQDTFTAKANLDPNNPSLNVTWKMMSCGGSLVNLAPCGTVAANGNYTPPQIVPPMIGVPLANSFVAQATAVADPSKTATTGSITINSTVTVAVAPVSPTLGINTQTKFTASVQNDPNNLGVTWSLGACPIAPTTNPSNPTPCGTLTPIDGFNVFYNAPPVVQPNAPLVTIIGTSVADTSKTGNSAITINSNVTVTVAPVNPTLGINTQTKFTATVLGDASNFGVTWSIACAATPTTTPANPNPCGMLTPIDGFNVFYNAPPVVQPNPPQVTITAKSVADTSKTGTSALTINSNVSVSVAIASASIPAPATGTVAIGFSVSFAAAVTGDSSSFGVKGWSVNGVVGGNSTVGKIVATDLTHATYTAPTAVPTPAAVNVTATSVADFTKTSPSSSIQVVSDQLVYDPANPTGQLNVPAAPATSGSVVIDLQGPANAPASAFACTDLGVLNGKASCSFAINTSASSGTCPSSQCTSVKLTLSVVRTLSSTIFDPVSHDSRGRLQRMAAFVMLLPVAVFGLVLLRRPVFSPLRIKHALAFVLLLCLALGWVSACNQFATPATPPPPISPTGAGTKGTLTITASPGGSFGQVTVPVQFLVQ